MLTLGFNPTPKGTRVTRKVDSKIYQNNRNRTLSEIINLLQQSQNPEDYVAALPKRLFQNWQNDQHNRHKSKWSTEEEKSVQKVGHTLERTWSRRPTQLLP